MITQKEYHLTDDTVILSTSDLQGNIVDYNKGFLEASGYTDAEIKGKPHSLLRHPDMPKEAFQDFWYTIQAGRPWFGIVKNRRKNGDHYWVAANASPIIENGQITGYLSVRYPASREQIAQATTLYAGVKNGSQKMPMTVVAKHHANIALAGVAMLAALAPSLLFMTDLPGLEPLVVATGVVSSAVIAYLTQLVINRSKPNAVYQRAIEEIANGKFQQKIPGNDGWAFSLNMIRSRVGDAAAKQYDAAQQAAILTTAMNAASTNLMVADADFNILSVNDSLARMFKRNERALQGQLPHFKADAIVGANMDIFHKDPSHQRRMVTQLTGPWQGELNVAGLVLRLGVVPIVQHNQRIGYVVEWMDRTQEANLEKQLQQISRAATNGVLNRRVDLTNAAGVYLAIGKDINQLIDTLEKITGVIAQSVGELAYSRLNNDMQGNFNGAYRSVQNSINLALRNLNDLMGQVQFTANSVNTAMQQLSDGVNHFADQTQQQAAAIERTASAMTQMLQTTRSNVEHVRHANQLAQGVNKRVQDSNEVMNQALGAMQQIHASGNKIGEIVTLIDSISFQTNLLALNAAVEAARAGEHGRGFAVVAAEVRSLAQKSAEAAKDIKQLIDASVGHIAEGTSLVERTSKALGDVSVSVDEMVSIVTQIDSASTEQEKGIEEVNRSLTVMDGVAQQSAALVEQTAASATHVADQMDGLHRIIKQFTLSDYGNQIQREGRSLLADMKQAHLNWRIRMSNVVQGYETITDVNSVRNHHLCGLGKWRDSEGKSYDHLPEMQLLDKLHAEFHNMLADAIESSKRGECDLANETLGRVDQMSDEIVNLLTRIEQIMLHTGASINKQQLNAPLMIASHAHSH